MLIPRREPWRFQPQYPVLIDRASSLFRGLILAAIPPVIPPNYHEYLTLTTRTLLGLVPPGSGYANGPSGLGWKIAATSDYISGLSTFGAGDVITEIGAGSNWTFEALIDGVGGSGTNPGFFRNASGSNGSTFLIQNGSTRRPWVRLNGADILKPASGPQWVSGQSLHIFARIKSAASVDVWWDGRKQHSATHSTATAAMTGTNAIYKFGVQTTTEVTTGLWQLVRFWNRAIEDDEIATLFDGPSYIFDPREELILLPDAAGVSMPVLSAPSFAGRVPSVTITH